MAKIELHSEFQEAFSGQLDKNPFNMRMMLSYKLNRIEGITTTESLIVKIKKEEK